MKIPKKAAGLLVPVFAIRSSKDIGIGDTSSVREMIDWCASHKLSLLQILPINETSSDHSPYNAISSIAIDPTTLSISPEAVPDLTEAVYNKLLPKDKIQSLRQGSVQYKEIKSIKASLFREAFQSFLQKHFVKNTRRAVLFREFLNQEGDWIASYSLFRSLMDLHDGNPSWEDWPLEDQTPARVRAKLMALPSSQKLPLEEAQMFYAYVQWVAFEQWNALKDYATSKNIMLIGDIPFGVSRCSADVWAERHGFNLNWSCGAPPEPYFKDDLFTQRWGQNWGVPLYRWSQMREDGFTWWKKRVQATSRFFHAFRIDHVLGFYRVYAFPWKPAYNGDYLNLSPDEARARAGDLPRFWQGSDEDPHQKWLNQQQGEETLRSLKEAAGETLVIAEDLGMVPDYVRPSLQSMDIPGFKIPIFDRNHDGSYQDSDLAPARSIGTFATHDHEPLAALWAKWSSEPDGAKEKEHFLRWAEWQGEAPSTLTPEIHKAACAKLFRSPSEMVILMITDLLGDARRFNVPGPASDSNWTERIPVPVDQLDSHPPFKPFVDNLKALLPRS